MGGSGDNRITRADIARLAGVSVATVSYALSGDHCEKIRPETRQRVCRIAREYGYVPKFSARSLSTGRSMNIAFLSVATAWLIDPMFHAVQYGLATEINRTEYTMLCFYEANRKFFQKLEQERFDGIVVFSSHLTPELRRLALDYTLPLIFVNLDVNQVGIARKFCHTVRADYAGLMHRVLAALAEAGCREVGLRMVRSPVCAPNDLMYAALDELLPEYRRRGIGFTMLEAPDEELPAELEMHWRSGRRFDGIYEDINRKARCRIAEIMAGHSRMAGRDYVLVQSDTANDHPAPDRVCLFTQPLVEIGRAAWGLMAQMLEGRDGKELILPFECRNGSDSK